MKKIELTRQEINDAVRHKVFKTKKKQIPRRSKHKKKSNTDDIDNSKQI